MAKTIAITSGKGGVGKSSVVVNMGQILAQMGYKVCMIDMDLGLKNLDIMMGLQHRSIYDLNDVMNNHCSLPQAMIRDKQVDNLYLIPACKSLLIEKFPKHKLGYIVDELKKQFDYILLDTPAGIEEGFQEAIACSDSAIVVTTLDVTSLQDGDRVIGLMMKAGIDDLGFVVNRFQPKLIDKGSVVSLEDAKHWLAIEFYGYIFEDEAIMRSNNHGKPLCYNRSNLTYECFYAIVKRYLKEYVPLPKYKNKSLLNRLFHG